MELRYVDSHCHLELAAFDADREDALARMRESGVGGVVVGVDLPTSRAAVELAERHDFLWAAVGLHPNDDPAAPFDAPAFSALARNPKVVAIGECGLDFCRNEPTPEEKRRQIERFKRHVDAAAESGKPLMIHCRPTRGTQNAHEEMLELLRKRVRRPEPAGSHDRARAVIHFFTSTADIAKQYLDLGCHLSFPGVITFTGMYDEAVRAVPLDRILSETDSPFAAPAPHRGKRNEPSFVIETVRRLAELKSVPFEETAAHIVQNAARFFGLAV